MVRLLFQVHLFCILWQKKKNHWFDWTQMWCLRLLHTSKSLFDSFSVALYWHNSYPPPSLHQCYLWGANLGRLSGCMYADLSKIFGFAPSISNLINPWFVCWRLCLSLHFGQIGMKPPESSPWICVYKWFTFGAHSVQGGCHSNR